MKKLFKLAITALTTVAMSSLSFADINPNCETALTCDTGLNSVVPGASHTTTNTVATPGTTTTTPATNTTTNDDTGYSDLGGDGSGAFASAMAAQQQAMMTAGVGALIAATSLPQCGPFNQFACVMGAAGIAVAMIGMASAGAAGNVGDSLGTGTVIDPTTGKTTTTPGSTATTSTTITDTGITGAQITQMKDDLAKKGYTINPDGTITLPNGQKISSFDPKSLTSAGISSKDANSIASGTAAMQKQIDDKLKAAQAAGLAGDGSGGRGGMQGQVGSGAGVLFGNDKNNKNTGANALNGLGDRNPASYTGLYKQFGDSVIGVSQSDLFLMVEKRVEKERKVMGQ